MPDSTNRSMQSHIGHRLRAVRRDLGMTLNEVSQLTDVSVSNLSKIEHAQVSPSFDIIKRICDGLRIGLEEFVGPGPEPKSIVSGRKTVTRGGEGVRFTSGQYDYKAHATELAHKGMVPLEMLIRARAVTEFDHWSQHQGEEFVYVLSGEIEIHTEHYVPFRLAMGESAYFDSNMKHLYLSVSPEDARVLSVSHDNTSMEDRIVRFMHPSTRALEPSPAAG